MPLVKVEIYKGKSLEYKKAIMNGIHEALVEAFKIPEEDRNQRLYELEEDNFERKSDKTKNFTIIEITAFKGRSREAKKLLYKKITEKLANNPGIKASDIIIYLNEVSLENWGIKGIMGDEVNFGFQIEV